MVRVELGVCAFGQMTDEAQRVDQNAFSFCQSCRTCDSECQHLGGQSSFVQVLAIFKPLRVLAQLKEAVGCNSAVAVGLILPIGV